MFHQLHCLNAVRKTFFPERYRDFFEDYWLDDGSPPGRAGRNYTSTDAKHYGEFLPLPPSSFSPNSFAPFPPNQTTASTLCGNRSCVTPTSPPSIGAGFLRATSPYPDSKSPTPAASSIGSATGARSIRLAGAVGAREMSQGGKRDLRMVSGKVLCRAEIFQREGGRGL